MFAMCKLTGTTRRVRLSKTLRSSLTFRPGAIILKPISSFTKATCIQDGSPQFPTFRSISRAIAALGPSVTHHHLRGIARHARLLLRTGVAYRNAGRWHGSTNRHAGRNHHRATSRSTYWHRRRRRRAGPRAALWRWTAWRGRRTAGRRTTLSGIDNWQTRFWKRIVYFYYRSDAAAGRRTTGGSTTRGWTAGWTRRSAAFLVVDLVHQVLEFGQERFTLLALFRAHENHVEGLHWEFLQENKEKLQFRGFWCQNGKRILRKICYLKKSRIVRATAFWVIRFCKKNKIERK